MREEIKKLASKEADHVLKLPNSYREAGRAKGRAKGIKEGIEEVREQVVYNRIEKELSDELIASKVKELRKNYKNST